MNKFKELRTKQGLSLAGLAKETGIGISTLLRLEQGGQAYTQTLYKLANFYEVEYSELSGAEFVSPKRDRQQVLNPLAV